MLFEKNNIWKIENLSKNLKQQTIGNFISCCYKFASSYK